MQAIEDANVVVLVVDAHEGVSEQDAHIAAFILECGRALVVAVNKWDGLDEEQRENVKSDVARKLQFLSFAKFHYISALKGSGLPQLFQSIDAAFKAAMAKLSTPKLTRALMDATMQHQPPISRGIRPKLRYAHQGGSNPPIVVIHGNRVEAIKDSYRRFLENAFRKVFELTGTPLRIQFKAGSNPYAGSDKPKEGGEGIVSMRKRKVAQRAELKARKEAPARGKSDKPARAKR